MIKRMVIGVVAAAVALVAMGGAAGAAQGPDSKKAFPVECQTGTLAGETLTVSGNKTAFFEDGTELAVTSLRFEFDGRVKEKTFGKTVGNLTCGGTEETPEGTFSFLATLIEV